MSFYYIHDLILHETRASVTEFRRLPKPFSKSRDISSEEPIDGPMMSGMQNQLERYYLPINGNQKLISPADGLCKICASPYQPGRSPVPILASLPRITKIAFIPFNLTAAASLHNRILVSQICHHT